MAKHYDVSTVPDRIGHASAPAAPPGQFSYGGQAVIEGVMMRGRSAMAVAVRTPSGEIVVWSDALAGSRLARRQATAK